MLEANDELKRAVTALVVAVIVQGAVTELIWQGGERVKSVDNETARVLLLMFAVVSMRKVRESRAATVAVEGVVEMKRWLRAIIRIRGINIIILLQPLHSNICCRNISIVEIIETVLAASLIILYLRFNKGLKEIN